MNIIHAFDSEFIDFLVKRCACNDIPLVGIHDDIGLPTTELDYGITAYKDYLIMLLENNYLEEILKQLPTCPEGFKLTKIGTLTAEDIRKSTFIMS